MTTPIFTLSNEMPIPFCIFIKREFVKKASSFNLESSTFVKATFQRKSSKNSINLKFKVWCFSVNVDE